MSLTEKQARFVAEYLKDLNATQAAIRAGYSKRTARGQASDLLTKPDIAKAVQDGQRKQLAAADVTAQEVIRELARIGFSDVRQWFSEDGNLRPIHELEDSVAAAIGSIEVTRQRTRTRSSEEESTEEWLVKVKAWNKNQALETLAKHFGLLKQTVDVPGLPEMAAVLARKVVITVEPGPTKDA